MNLEELKAKALAALDEAIPAHLRSNRHGESFLGDRHETIRRAIEELFARAALDDMERA